MVNPYDYRLKGTDSFLMVNERYVPKETIISNPVIAESLPFHVSSSQVLAKNILLQNPRWSSYLLNIWNNREEEV